MPWIKAILNDSWRAEARNLAGANKVNPAPAYTDARRTLRRLTGLMHRSLVFIGGPPVRFRGSRYFADRGTVSKPRSHCNTLRARLHSLFSATSPLVEKDGNNQNDANGHVLPEGLNASDDQTVPQHSWNERS